MAQEQLNLTLNANAVSNGEQTVTVTAGEDGNRAPRLPRWTRQEILVLIQGKKVAENRVRRGRVGSGLPFGSVRQLEPKWASVSSYCKRHGVNRGPVQCRKRWSNLAGDYKKIKEWESQIGSEGDSFWVMRNDLRREKKLPGFFDREVFEILDGGVEVATATTEMMVVEEEGKEEGVRVVGEEEGKEEGVRVVGEEEGVVFDSGRAAGADDGLFSDFEQEDGSDSPNKESRPATVRGEGIPAFQAPVPISEKHYQPMGEAYMDQGMKNEKPSASNIEKGSASEEGRKRRRVSSDEDTNMQDQLIKVVDSNSRMLTAQLEAQNINCELDRDQRKDQANSLVAVLNKLADALGRIAEKL